VNYNPEKIGGSMSLAVYKVTCHMCDWHETAGTMAEAKYFSRAHKHIDVEIKRVA
jgi:hypothetical protein